MLASFDEARDYDAVSPYNWLNAKLRELYGVVQGGGRVQVEDPGNTILLGSKLAFIAWAIRRYPAAEFGQSKLLVVAVTCTRFLFGPKI
jgi:hypothetical protein